MRISELKRAIREMVVSELNEAEMGQVTTDNSTKAAELAKKGVNVVIPEDEALNEMAKIAGDLKAAIEKVIEKNKDGEKKDIRKAIKTDDEVQAALGPDDDLFDNQLNKFIDLVIEERDINERLSAFLDIPHLKVASLHLSQIFGVSLCGLMGTFQLTRYKFTLFSFFLI
jgi:hypothetical protein